ncbi:MAG: tRNA (adenosine(37)-N6)-threonylcarbamoyltransferase complex ATPase subunit type 1 TsaE [Tetrasphaera sp.]
MTGRCFGPGELRTAAETAGFGRALATVCRAGDLVVLAGDLGAGKTTLTQGIGAGLRVRGDVTSPTFVIARVHPPLGDGPALVHVDAYRLGSIAELDDMDLDATLEQSVTVVEWGEGLAEDLADSHLLVVLEADPVTECRRVRIDAVGERWAAPAVRAALEALVAGGGASGRDRS